MAALEERGRFMSRQGVPPELCRSVPVRPTAKSRHVKLNARSGMSRLAEGGSDA